MLHYQGLFFILKAIRLKLISCHYNNPLAEHFGIKKTCKLLTQKYYCTIFRQNDKAYIKGCDGCLASKVVRHKSYSDL